MKIARFLFVVCCLYVQLAAASEPKKILGLGHAVMDFFLPVDEAFLQEHVPVKKGGCLYCADETFFGILSKSLSQPQMTPGGNTPNTLRILAQMGEPCVFLSAVGTDPSGESFCRNLEASGIEGQFVPTADSTTIRVACLVTPDAQRTFLCAGPEIWTECVDEKPFEGVKWVHIESRLLKSQFPMAQAMQFAQGKNIPISIDLSSCETICSFREDLLDLINRYVDVVFCNEQEILALTGSCREEGIRVLQQICPLVVVTLGADGCLVASSGEITQVPPFPAETIDTTGAGDVFSGGFIYGFLRGYQPTACARIGNFFGSLVVQVVGTRIPEEKWGEVYQFLDREQTLLEQNQGSG